MTTHNDSRFVFTEFASEEPNNISKTYCLGENNEIIKQPPKGMRQGRAIRSGMITMEGFADLLDRQPNHAKAFAYGVCGIKKAQIITKRALKRNEQRYTISRTREFFSFSDGPGIMMLDYDPAEESTSMSQDELLAALYSACPALKDAPHVVTASASSFIYNGDAQLKGASGWHVYVLVQEAKDIPRAGEVLFEKTWLHGHGYIKINTAGNCLERSLIDKAVFQPERLDFISGACCHAPIEQRRPKALRMNLHALPLDTREHLPPLADSEKRKLIRLKSEAVAKVADEAARVRQRWIREHAEEAHNNLPHNERSAERLTSLEEEFRNACETQTLGLNFVLYPEEGGQVTVAEVLSDPGKWHGTRFADPLEPEYRNDKRIAQVNMEGYGEPYIHSFAHGGVRYFLSAEITIRIVNGQRTERVEEALDQLRLGGNVYVHSGTLVKVTEDGQIIPMNRRELQYKLDELIRWECRKGDVWKPVDAKEETADGILAKKGEWKLPNLRQVLRMPTMVPRTGELIAENGYHKKTEIMIVNPKMKEWPGILNNPGENEVKAALASLWKPFEEFPLDTQSRSSLLAALLTIPLRPLLPTAPGYVITAPRPASGKTLLAKSLASLTGVDSPSASGFPRSDEELDKRLLAAGLEGAKVIFIDNISHPVKSDKLCTWLTTETLNGRVLGESRNADVSTKSLLLLTGNNIRLAGDICRRMLKINIDPEQEYGARTTAYKCEPFYYCKEHRLELNAAALTILKAARLDNDKPISRTESFEEWSDTVRHAVCWVGRKGYMEACDPTESMMEFYKDDPEAERLKSIIDCWHHVFGNAPHTVSDLLESVESQTTNQWKNVYAHLTDISEGNGTLNPNKIGIWLRTVEGRKSDGKVFVRNKKPRNVQSWRVEVA